MRFGKCAPMWPWPSRCNTLLRAQVTPQNSLSTPEATASLCLHAKSIGCCTHPEPGRLSSSLLTQVFSLFRNPKQIFTVWTCHSLYLWLVVGITSSLRLMWNKAAWVLMWTFCILSVLKPLGHRPSGSLIVEQLHNVLEALLHSLWHRTKTPVVSMATHCPCHYFHKLCVSRALLLRLSVCLVKRRPSFQVLGDQS